MGGLGNETRRRHLAPEAVVKLSYCRAVVEALRNSSSFNTQLVARGSLVSRRGRPRELSASASAMASA